MFCCTLLYVHSSFAFILMASFAIILMGKRELVAMLSLSSWCLVIVVWLSLAVPWVCLQFVVVVFPDHTHLLFKEMAKPQSVTYSSMHGSSEARIAPKKLLPVCFSYRMPSPPMCHSS